MEITDAKRAQGKGGMARLTYRQFLKAQIDLEPLGLIMDGPFEAYFCTPKGARIFARSGWTAFISALSAASARRFFAVSPMNGRENCVHPVAKSFRDFLRLLLALHDAAAIEQAWQWNAAQLEEFEQKHPSSDRQLAALDKIVFTFHLRPMGALEIYPYGANRLRLWNLRFSENLTMTHQKNAGRRPWQVTFEGSFWGVHGKPGRGAFSSGKHVFLGRGASGSFRRRMSAKRSCAGYHETHCRSRSFVPKVEPLPENDPAATGRQAQRIRAQGGKSRSMKTSAQAHGQRPDALAEVGCGLCWDALYPEETTGEAKRVQAHYSG